MKKILFSLILIFLGGFMSNAQIITFDDQGHVDNAFLPNPYTIVNGGETFSFAFSNGGAPLPGNHRYKTTDTEGCANTSLSYLRVDLSATQWSFQTQSGNEFNLNNVRFLNMYGCPTYGNFAYAITVQGFKNGVATGSPQAFSVTGGNSIFTPNATFDDVDRVVVTCADLAGLGIDDVNWGPPIVACTQPSIPSVTATSPICAGGSTTLNISGSLNDATQWHIYTGFCGVTPVGTTAGSTFVVSPSTTTAYYVRGQGGCTTPGTCGAITINVSNLNQSAAGQTNVSCFGGSNGAASVSTTGGAAPYSYNWTPGNPTGDGTASVTGLSAGAWTCTVTDANGCTKTVNFTIIQPSAITSSISAQTNVSCNGGSNGSATVLAGGGTPGYTYSWSPSGGTAATITGRPAGTYTCTITDANGCTKTQIATITQPSAITSSISAQTNVSCNGGSNGSATVLASGGTPGYTYSWSPSGGTAATATGLAAGTYTCTITDANGCTKTQTAIMTQPGAIVMNSNGQTNTSCNAGSDGTASVTAASNGTGPYTYNWTPGNPPGDGTTSVTGLTAGAWTCTVTDANGCTKTVNFTITQPSAITSSVSAQNNVSCNLGNDGGATVAVSGGTPGYTYSWSPSGGTAATITGRPAGTYTCTITDANGCTKTQIATITQPSAITSSISVQTNVSCNGGSNGSATVLASGGTPGYTYSWSPSGGTTATATGLAAGIYTCTIVDGNGCTKTQIATITQPSAITSSISAQTNVSCNGGSNGSATVLAGGGTPGYTYSWSPSGGTAATITGRTAGTYTCTITDANGCTKTQAVTITQPSAITSSISAQTNVACNGGATGSATVLASGGTPGYTYSWSPSGGTAATASGLAAGTYTCTITDANGCTKTQAATITQPSAITMTLLSSMNPTCGSANGAASMNPAAGGTPGYTYNWTPGNPTGDGTTSVTGLTAGTWTCTVTDANGCTKSTSVTITSTDVTPPIAVCQNFTTTLNGSGAATITAANINNGSSDNCGAVTLSASQTTFSCANIGPNNVTLTVTDGSGNSSSCVAVVTVTDNTPPLVSCPGNQTEATNTACNFTLPNYTGLAVGTDNCGGVTLTQSPLAGTVISANTVVTITATDGSGNAATCTFNVILNFSACVGAECTNAIALAPLLPCGSQTVETGSTVGGTTSTETSFCGTSAGTGGANWYTFTGDGGTWTASTVNAGTNYDTKLWIYEGLCGALNCIGGNDDFSGVQSQTSFATTAGANYYIVVGGYSSNEGNYVLTVSNAETTAPVADLATLPDVIAECEVTSLSAPTATDNCSATVTVTNNATLPITTQGTTVVTWAYDDGNGNTSTQTQNVILTDVTAPVPDLATLADVTADCEVTTLAPPTATDACSGTVTVTNDAVLPISGQGTSVVTWTYTDVNGNAITQTQNVVIQDVTGPTPDVPVLSDVNAVCEVTSLFDPSAVDNCGGVVTVSNDATLPISAQGTTVVTWTYTDIYGNISIQTQNIVIADNENPVPDLASLPAVSSSCAVTLDAPSAMDNCAGVITATTSTTFPITANGTTTVVWEFNDGNGNVVTQNQTVVISGIDVSVSLAANGVTITASNPGGPGVSFNWLDCNAAFGAIPGASSSSYTSLINGSYAVRISENGCADTSVCITINSADLSPLTLEQVTVYPNPSKDGYFTVNYDGIIEAIDVVDMLGRVIELPTDLQNGAVDGSTLTAGQYMVRITTNETVLITEIVIAQ